MTGDGGNGCLHSAQRSVIKMLLVQEATPAQVICGCCCVNRTMTPSEDWWRASVFSGSPDTSAIGGFVSETVNTLLTVSIVTQLARSLAHCWCSVQPHGAAVGDHGGVSLPECCLSISAPRSN